MPMLAVYICPHTVMSSLGTASDCFSLANQFSNPPLFKILKVSHNGQPVTTAYGEIKVDGDLKSAEKADIFLIPAIGQQIATVIKDNQPLLHWLHQQAVQGKQQLASLCSAAFVLAAAGTLDGHAATTHWALADKFRQTFPRVKLTIEQLVTHDGQILCSGGAQAGVDLCLHIIRLYGGDWLARQVASALVVDYGRGLQTRFVPRLPPPQQQDLALASLQRWLEQHYAQTVTLEAMAERLHCSPRTLLRRFKDATGLTPNDYLQRVRISAAESRLAESRQTIEQIAAQVGYENRAAFAKLFKQMTGETPAAYRQRVVNAQA